MPKELADVYNTLVSGSMKNTWKNVDALDYQKALREERTIG